MVDFLSVLAMYGENHIVGVGPLQVVVVVRSSVG